MTGPAVPSNPKADLWDAFVKAGLPPDSATKSVNAASDAGLSNADAYDHFVLQKPLPQQGTPGVDPTRPAQAFFDHVADLATGGQGKKALAAVQSLAAGHGLNDYASNLARTNHDLEAESAANHKTSLAGGLLGGIVSPLNKVVAPLGLLGGGAAIGAIQGSGAAKDDLSSQLVGAGVGGAVGGATAGVLGTALKAAFGSTAAQRLVLAASKDGGVLDQLQQLVAQGKGALPTLADLSPKLRDILDGAASKSLDVAENVRNIAGARDASTMGRLASDFRSANPYASGVSLAAQKEAAEAATRAGDKVAYGAVEQNTGALPPKPLVAAISSHPAILDVLRKGLLAGDIENAPQVVKGLFPEVEKSASKSIYSLLLDQGVPEAKAAATDPAGAAAEASKTSGGRDLNYRDVQSFAQELDDKVGSLFKNGKRNLALQYKDALIAVRGYLSEHAPGHAAADAQHAASVAAEEALAQGHMWYGGTAGDIEHGFSQMTAPEQDAARRGWATAALEHMSSKNPNADMAKAYASGDMQQQAKLMFGSQANFDKFMLNAQQEANLSRLASVNSGSQTARRLAGSAGDLGPMARFVTAQAHGRGLVSSALSAATPNVVRASTEAGAKQVGGLLTTQGSDAITDLLAQLQAKQNVGNLFGLGAVGAGGAAGGIASGLLGSK